MPRQSQVPRPSCEPSELGNLTDQDNEADNQVGCMDRGMQAVPVLVEGGSQTQLTHPKNVYIQYESRSFTKEELTDTFSSNGFQSFLNQAEGLFQEVQCPMTNVTITIAINISISISIITMLIISGSEARGHNGRDKGGGAELLHERLRGGEGDDQ